MAKHSVQVMISARDQASKVFGGVGKNAMSMGAMIKRAAVMAGAYLSARQLLRFAKGSAQAHYEQAQATAKLAQALKATGNAAGFSLKQLQDYANELQGVTTIGNETIETGMSILATFKNIQGGAFKRTTELAMDLATAMGDGKGGLKSAMLQLGKAVNDPKTGLTMLNRVGITFSEEQKKRIYQLVEENRLYEAQTVMLNEVAGQFGGQARAAAQAAGGPLKQLSNAWGDARERLGKYLDNAPGVQTAIKMATVGFENLGTVADMVWTKLKLSSIGFWEDFKHLFAVQIPELFQWFGRNWRDVFTTLWNGTKSVFSNMFDNVKNFFKATWSWLKGDGFDFQWTGLLEGFESTLKELPKITERTMTSVEKELAAKLASSQDKLGKALAAKMAPAAAIPGIGGFGAGASSALATAGGGRGGGGTIEARFLGGGGRVSEETLVLRKILKLFEKQERMNNRDMANKHRRDLGAQTTKIGVVKSLG